jgi:D-3-phosphoglycerate dehydrogenase
MAGGVRVLISDRLDPGAAKKLVNAGLEVIEKQGLAEPALIEALEGCAALMVRSSTQVTANVLQNAAALRVVARAGTGLDNIDAVAARELGIEVVNTPAVNAVSVAELTFALLLALERHIVPASGELRVGRWEKTRFMGRELHGRRLGLSGFGRIGREVAMRARAFGMEVWASDPLLVEWPAGFEWVRATSMKEMLPNVDVLSLHVPLVPGTRGMIGAAELAMMRPDAILVNCARGGVVDEDALLEALEAKQLRGACLDVFATEPPGEHPLLELPNVIATPHLGASTAEAQARAANEAADRVIEFLARL